MFRIKQVKETFVVKKRGFKDISYSNLNNAINLCRLRCHKVLIDDDLKVIKIPFFKLWLVW